jgi:hypothetical protein
MGEMTPGYTANRAVNAVPYVCAAPPGIRTTVDLPQIIPALGGGVDRGRTWRRPPPATPPARVSFA